MNPRTATTSDVPRNGDHVTWRELRLVVQPLKDAIDDVKGTVDGLDGKLDNLLLERAEDKGGERAKKSFLESGRFWITTSVLMFTGTISAIATIVWLKV